MLNLTCDSSQYIKYIKSKAAARHEISKKSFSTTCLSGKVLKVSKIRKFTAKASVSPPITDVSHEISNSCLWTHLVHGSGDLGIFYKSRCKIILKSSTLALGHQLRPYHTLLNILDIFSILSIFLVNFPKKFMICCIGITIQKRMDFFFAELQKIPLRYALII